MGETRFSSVISTQTVGTGDLDKLTASFDKLSQTISDVSKKSEQIKPPKWEAFAASVRDGIQNPLQAAGAAAEKVLMQMGPLGGAASVAAIGFGIFAKAGFDAMRSLGTFGVEMERTAVRMGLTIKEVGEFSFAMKRSGGDIQGLETGMRKLSAGLADGGEEGKKAADALRKMGVATVNLRGDTLPMADIFLGISRSLNAMSDTAERDATAVKILGRSALQSLPDILKLSEGIDRARQLGLAPSEGDVKRWEEYHKQVVEAEAIWERFKRNLKDGIAGVVTIVVKPLIDSTEESKENAGTRYQPGMGGMTRKAAAEMALRAAGIPSGMAIMEGQIAASQGAGKATIAADRTRYGGTLAGAQFEAEEAKKKSEALRAEYFNLEGQAGSEAVNKKRQEWNDAEAAATRLTEKVKLLAKAEADRLAAPDYLIGVQKHSREAMDAARFAGDDRPDQKARQAYDRAVMKSYAEEIADLRKYGVTPKLRAGLSAARQQERSAAFLDYSAASKTHLIDSAIDNAVSPSSLIEHSLDEMRKWGTIGKNDGLNFSPVSLGLPGGYMSVEQQLRDVKQRGTHELGLMDVQGRLSGTSEGTLIKATEQAKLRYAQQEYDAQMRLAAVQTDEFEKDRIRNDAEDQLSEKRFEAQMDREHALLDIALRQKEQFQSIAVGFLDAGRSGGGAGLSKFVLGQVNGIEDKVVSNAAGMAWPMIKNAMGGLHASSPDSTFGKLLAGTPFGADPAKVGIDLNTMETRANTVATQNLTTALASVRGSSLSPSGGGGGAGGFGGLGSLPGLYSSSSPTDAEIASAGITPEAMASLQDVGETGPNAGGGFSTISPGVAAKGGVAKGIGIGAAAVTAAFGAYSGFKAGGAQGALQGTASILGAASLIPGPQQPFVMAAAMATTLIATVLGDPKANREAEIGRALKYNQYMAPVAINASMTTGGTYADFDRFGGVRSSGLSPFPTVEQGFFDYRHNTTVQGRTLSDFGPPVVHVHINAMDSKSILDRHQDIGDAVVRAMKSSHTGLQEEIRNL